MKLKNLKNQVDRTLLPVSAVFLLIAVLAGVWIAYTTPGSSGRSLAVIILVTSTGSALVSVYWTFAQPNEQEYEDVEEIAERAESD